MEDILNEISKLSVRELQKQLREAKQPSGPILPSTRPTFERRLAKYIHRSRGGVEEESPQKDSTDGDCNTERDGHGTAKFHESSTDRSSSHQPGSEVPKRCCESEHRKTSEEEKTGDSVPVIYYAVCLHRQSVDDIDGPNDDGSLHVYTLKEEALQVVKKNKGSRFKAFRVKEDAENFSKSVVVSSADSDKSPLQATVSEKANEFKAPKMQELVQLRKAIESGNKEKFTELVWSNPRYLVSSGDSPVILQVGFRYNALHVAAKANQAEMCRLILDTIADSKFLYLMYPDDDSNTHSQRMEYVMDLYLNVPDEPTKGNCETPLHFACKFGHIDVVEVLLSFPGVDKLAKNKEGLTPSEIACCRAGCAKIKEDIQALLKDHYYVPLIRAEDDVTVGTIGEPWSPSTPIHQSSPLSKQRIVSPLDPVVTIKAYAGPMTSKQAQDFHKKWKTPPRSTLKGTALQIRREDSDKGLERHGRDLAQTLKLPWMEFWDFLGCYANLSTPEGLSLLEKYLAGRSNISPDYPVHVKPDAKKPPLSANSLSESGVVKSLTESLELAKLDDDECMDVGTASGTHREGAEKSEPRTEVAASTETTARDSVGPTSPPSCEAECAGVPQVGSSADAKFRLPNLSARTKDGMLLGNIQFKSPHSLGNVTSVDGSTGSSTSTDVWTWRPSQSSAGDSFSSSASENDTVFDSPDSVGGGNNIRTVKHKPCLTLEEELSKLTLSQDNAGQSDPSDISDNSLSNSHRTSSVGSTEEDIGKDNTLRQTEPSMVKPDLSLNAKSPTHARDSSKIPNEVTDSKSGQNQQSCDVDMVSLGTQASATSPTEKDSRVNYAKAGFLTPQVFRTSTSGHAGPDTVFITGCHPTKLDLDVLRAVNKANSVEKYPNILKWKSMVTSYPVQTQVGWPSPAAPRLRKSTQRQSEVKRYSPSPVVNRSPLHLAWKNSPIAEFKLRHVSEPAFRVGSPKQRSFPTNLSRSFANQL